MTSFEYTVLPGFFAQTETSTDQASFDPLQESFGLLRSRAPAHASDATGWHDLCARVQDLNSTAPTDTSYKVLFLARHGLGWHNVAQAQYGTEAWNENFSKLDGADDLQWFDARLTPEGESQARAVARQWAELHHHQDMPVPETFYCSPLIRCLQTARLTHAGPEWGFLGGERYTPVVKEGLRETIGVHTCDRRSPKSAIAVRFPEAVFEDGFASEDELWSAKERETPEHQNARLKELLDGIFATDNRVFISITAHSGTSRAILKTLKFPHEWQLKPGEMLPIVVEARRMGR